MTSNDLQSVLQRGIQAAQAGERKAAKDLFVQALKQDPRSEVAWMWMVSVVDTDKERRFCLEKILEINPNNQRARQALDQLQEPAVPDWLREAARPQAAAPPTPTPSRPAVQARDTEAPPAAQPPAPEESAEESWAEWEMPDFEDEAVVASTGVEALRAEAVASEKGGRRGRRRLRIVLLILLILAFGALAVILIQPQLTGGVGGQATTAATLRLTEMTLPTETPGVTDTAAPTRTVTRTPRPTATPTATVGATEEPAGSPALVTPTQETLTEPTEGRTPLTEETTGSQSGAADGNVFEGEVYALTYPDDWTVTTNPAPEGDAITQVTLSRGGVNPGAGPLPEMFAFALIDTVASGGGTVEELLQAARTVASETANVPPAVTELDAGELSIGGEAGAFEFYTLSPDEITTIFVYAAATTHDDQDFVFILFSTDEADRATAEAMLESVVFEAAS